MSPHQPSNMDFPSEVVKTWEEASDETYHGIHVVKLRTGVVLGNESGAFPKMKLPYLLGFGGNIGSGKQWVSWIHLTDIVRLIDFCTQNPTINGPVNATTPHPVTNEEFGRTIGKVYKRNALVPFASLPVKNSSRRIIRNLTQRSARPARSGIKSWL